MVHVKENMEITFFVIMVVLALAAFAFGIFRRSAIPTLAAFLLFHASAVQAFSIDMYTNTGTKVTFSEPAFSWLLHSAEFIALIWLFACMYFMTSEYLKRGKNGK